MFISDIYRIPGGANRSMHKLAAVEAAEALAFETVEKSKRSIAASVVVAHRELVHAGLERDDRRADLAVLAAGVVDQLYAVNNDSCVPSRIDLKLVNAVGGHIEKAVEGRDEWFLEVGRLFELV